ncbi:MAG TPA: DCC1-like thiol-disulfide oxidoreductase family protein, partial [Blastocatellia bacterium]|nr:DCC1-like thiol-disulfide oxidoreductase family protein [Blastocatellia bacterium]
MNQMRPDIKSESASLQSSIVHDLVFYDGHCGLCHGLVLFVLARDQEGKNFRFAPLGGKTFERLISQERRQTLPDSIVLLSHSGEVYTRSAAI